MIFIKGEKITSLNMGVAKGHNSYVMSKIYIRMIQRHLFELYEIRLHLYVRKAIERKV